MNNFKISRKITELKADNLSADLKTINDDCNNQIGSYYKLYNSNDISIESGMFKFDGSKNNGLVWNFNFSSSNVLAPDKKSYLIEMNFIIQGSNNTTTDKIQTLMINMENSTSNKIANVIYISPEKNWLSFCFFNTSSGTYSSWNGFYKFEKNVLYNLKIIVLKNNEFGIYINNKLICQGNTKNATARGGGTKLTSLSSTYFIGMQLINNTSYNFRGLIDKFKVYNIYSDDEIIYANTLYSKNMILYVPLDYTTIQTVGHLYNDVSIKNLGCKKFNISYDTSTTYENQFNINLGGDYISWFKPIGTCPLYFDNTYIKTLENYSISMRIKTGDTLNDSALIDTRTTTGVYNGFLLTQPSADPSSLRLYISNVNEEYDSNNLWFETISSETDTIKINSEYLITILYKNGTFELYVDGVKKGESVSNNILPNITSSNIYFGCNSNKTSVFNGHVRDISIYDIAVLPQDDIYVDNESYDYKDYIAKFENNAPYTIEFSNTKIISMSIYDDSDVIYRGDNIFKKIYFYNEGGSDNDIIKLYENGNLFIKSTGFLDYNFIDNSKLHIYTLQINDGEFKQLINLSKYRGEIRGFVSASNCDVDAKELSVLCFSSNDHRYIGEFNIENGSYVIPNLDALLKYDIVLVDKSRTIEQKVLSYRTPEPYSN